MNVIAKTQRFIEFCQANWAAILMLYHALDLLVEAALAAFTGSHVGLPSAFDLVQGDHMLLGELSPGCKDGWAEFWQWLSGNACAGGSSR